MSHQKLYSLITAVCLSSYLWIFFSYRNSISSEVCPFRRLTHLPCPSCGSTRAVISILHGDFAHAFYYNPLGYLVVLILLVCPLWLFFDLFSGKTTLIHFYHLTENLLKKRIIALFLILLISLNWIWNLTKGI